jgi:hypothetical protein
VPHCRTETTTTAKGGITADDFLQVEMKVKLFVLTIGNLKFIMNNKKKTKAKMLQLKPQNDQQHCPI